jgi:hypothetical protein
MRLRTPPWKTAWYEEGLSERFAQEMTRIEKTVAREIETSAQWVEQLVIELGLLAQNMIHLEGETRRDSQIRLAFEKALKVSALAAHLMGALDQAADRGPTLLRYSSGDPLDHPKPGSAGAPEAVTPTAAVPHTAAPAQAAAAQHPQVLRPSAAAQIGLKRQAAVREAPPPLERPGTAPPPLVSPLMDVSQPMITPSGNPMREMILSLSRRGLSRSEIEVITEQPRHVIEAVLAAG